MALDRFLCYISGGTPQGGSRSYPGARDQSPPRGKRGLWLDGQVYFALESTVWTGGMAFLDPRAQGSAAGRGYLVTFEQFSDIVDQEMHRKPGTVSISFDTLLGTGTLALGPGRYETLVVAGYEDGVPIVTFTAREPMRPLNSPSQAYVNMLKQGLAEAHGWDADTSARYLAGLPGYN